MSFKLLKLDQDEAVFEIEIDADSIENEIMKEFKKTPEAEKQMAPLSDKAVLAQHPGLNKIASQALNNLLPNYYSAAIKELSLKPMTYPQIMPRETRLGEPCVVEIRVGLEPEITLIQYEGLEATYVPVIVAEEDVMQQLAGLRQQRGTGDDDEALLQTLPFDSIEDFTAEIRSSLQSLADEKMSFNKRNAVVRQLIAANPFPVRTDAVDEQVLLMINQFRQQVGAQNFDSYLKSQGKSFEKVKQEVRPEAEEAVRKNLLLAAVADKIDPEVCEDDIKETLIKHQNSIQDVALSYEARRDKLAETPGAMEQLFHAIRLEKATEYIVDKASLKEGQPVRILDQQPGYME